MNRKQWCPKITTWEQKFVFIGFLTSLVLLLVYFLVFLYQEFLPAEWKLVNIFFEKLPRFGMSLFYFGFIQGFILFTYCTHGQNKKNVSMKSQNGKRRIPLKNGLDFSAILLKEFDYARETASQAMNDRHTLVNYFLIITGVSITLVSTAFSIDKNAFQIPVNQYRLLEVICLAFNFIGWIYFIKIIRLRQAWHDSATEMNHIKDFYINNSQVKTSIAEKAFLWKTATIPPVDKKSNVFYYSAMIIAFITSLAYLISSIGVLIETDLLKKWLWLAALLGIYHLIFQIFMYSVFLTAKKGEAGESHH